MPADEVRTAPYLEDGATLISFANGYNAHFTDGVLTHLEPCDRPIYGPGLTVVASAGTNASALLGHGMIEAIKNRKVIRSGRPFYLKGFHEYNDRATVPTVGKTRFI